MHKTRKIWDTNRSMGQKSTLRGQWCRVCDCAYI